MTTASDNKSLMTRIMNEVAKGNTRPFADAMADDLVWYTIGTTAWSGTCRGKQAVREKIFAPLFAQFADSYTSTPTRILADGDHVVVECRGAATTKAGKPYNNTYCLVMRMSDGKISEMTEYLDTALVDAALAPPA